VAYEMGVDYAISPIYKLTVSGFYKDYYSQLNTEEIKLGPTTFEYYANTDYARSRGLEMELNKRYGGYISGYVNYQYAFAYGKSSAEVSNYYDRAYAGDIPIQEFPLDWDVRHQITLNLSLVVSQDEHPRVFGFKLPDKWGINMVWQYGSGLPFDPASNYPGLVLRLRENPIPNSRRLPPNSNVDLRFDKDFQAGKINYRFQVWITNLFDKTNVYDVFGSSGRPDTDQNYFDEVWGQNVVYLGREIERNPLNYGQGRNVRLGLSVNF
jgi:outer membrane receptor protein involved in Fe transport